MEKKVLLKDLVDFGTHVRKQITSKVRVSDQGVYPIGEIWDANTTLDIIVNGAHEQHDTIRELDSFVHDINDRLVEEVARAKNAELQLDNKKADKSELTALANIITVMQNKITELEEKIEDIISGEIPVNSITSEHIVDGTIRMDDLSDEVADKLQIDVDESEENATFGS